MMLGALMDLGLDEKRFRNELAGLNLDGYHLAVNKVTKHGVVGTDIQVTVLPSHKGGLCAHDGTRNLSDIEKLITESDLRESVKTFSLGVFREIAQAEAHIHNVSIDDIHFHEIGAVDSIVDIVGVGIALDLLDIVKFYASAVHDGCGFITCRHGVLPVPVPAVLQMLTQSDIPFSCTDVSTELVTPTGIGLLKGMTPTFGPMPAMRVHRVGYGYGKRDTGRFNALRVIEGELCHCALSTEEIVELETNIDDMNPEMIGYVIEKLLQDGALDVYTTPIYMKKNRPAVKLSVLTDLQNEARIKNILFTETTSLGIRRTIKERFSMKRRIVAVETPFGPIRIKVADMDLLKKTAPEYEDCKRAAQIHGVPLQTVYAAAQDAAKTLR